jgi:hypothetical protein
MVSPELLRRYPFFAGMTDEELSAIAKIAMRRPTRRLTSFTRESPNTSTSSPQVRLTRSTRSRRPRGYLFVGAVAAGEAFGLSAFNEPYLPAGTARTRLQGDRDAGDESHALRHQLPFELQPDEANCSRLRRLKFISANAACMP